MFLGLFIAGGSSYFDYPENPERFLLGCLFITLAIFGGYENGKKEGRKNPLED